MESFESYRPFKKKWNNIIVEFKRVSAFNYALYHCEFSIFSAFTLHNESSTKSPPLRVSAIIEGYSDLLVKDIEPLPPYDTADLDQIDLRMDYVKLEGQEGTKKARLTVKINDEIILEEAIPILGFYEWASSHDYSKSLACFVQPANPRIQSIVLDAIGYLPQSAFISFRDLKINLRKQRADSTLRALYECLCERYNIHYDLSPAWSRDDGSQVIRPPHVVISDLPGDSGVPGRGKGTCIDLVLLFAACLENLRLQTVAIFVEGKRKNEQERHVLLGCRRNVGFRTEGIITDYAELNKYHENEDLIVVETTGVTRRFGEKLSFDEATYSAKEQLSENPERFLFAVDIAAVRPFISSLQFPINPGVLEILNEADTLADEERKNSLETKHLLLSFFLADHRESEGIEKAFKESGIDPEEAKNIARRMIVFHPYSLEERNQPKPRSTLNYNRVLEDARFIAGDTSKVFIDKPHLFYAILITQSEEAGRILNEMGIDRDQTKEAFRQQFGWARDVKDSYSESDDHGPGRSEPFIEKTLHYLMRGHIEQLTLDFELPEDMRERAFIPSAPFRVLDPVGDKWLILDRIGEGRSGIVYLAFDRRDGELVALKTIRENSRATPDARSRLLKEIRTWTGIEPHPYILRAKDIDKVGDKVYVSMEYIPPARDDMDGSSLRDWLLEGIELDKDRILRWAIEFCDGMQHAYDHQLRCHGDICPENILIDQNDNIKITDFGLALYGDGEEPENRDFGHIQQMAPERISNGGEADILTDIYSFGAILFEMVTGRNPFNIEQEHYTFFEDWKRAWEQAHRQYPVPDVGEPFNRIIHKCLSKYRKCRYESFGELKEDLTALCKEFNYHIPEAGPVVLSCSELNMKGAQSLILGQYQEAISFFEQTLEREKDNSPAMHGKGICQLGLGYFDEAGQTFDEILELDKLNVSAMAGKGCCLMKLEQFDEADQYFDYALNVDQRFPALWYHKGKNLLKRHQTKKAIECYYKALELLISQKRKEEALDIVKEGLEKFPSDLRLMQLKGWIFRLRDLDEEELKDSLEILEPLYHRNQMDPDTAGILAGTCKRLWELDPIKYVDHLQKAFDLYKKAWEGSGRQNTYVGINTATLSLLLGNREVSRQTAGKILRIFEKSSITNLPMVGPKYSGYWDRVTQAEAELLLGRMGKARRIYQDIIALYKKQKGCIDSSLDQMDLILPRLGISLNARDFLNLSPKVPGVKRVSFGIIGASSRFFHRTLKEKIKQIMDHIQHSFPEYTTFKVSTQLANKAEILSATIFMAELGAHLKAMLPLEVDEYFRRVKPGDDFQSCINAAEEIYTLSNGRNLRQSRVKLREDLVDQSDILIIICDGERTSAKKEDNDLMRHVKKKNMPFVSIDINEPHKHKYENCNLEKIVNDLEGGPIMDEYEPKPIDTSHIQLADDLIELEERLAENLHDNWAKLRKEEGWKYGPRTKDGTKEHKNLVPYENLPTSEKELDRNNAMETLKSIVSLGYRIEKINGN